MDSDLLWHFLSISHYYSIKNRILWGERSWCSYHFSLSFFLSTSVICLSLCISILCLITNFLFLYKPHTNIAYLLIRGDYLLLARLIYEYKILTLWTTREWRLLLIQQYSLRCRLRCFLLKNKKSMTPICSTVWS